MFNLDGILWHSRDIHARALAQAFSEIGIKIAVNIDVRLDRVKTETAVIGLMEEFGTEHIQNAQTIENLINRKCALASGWLNSEVPFDPETGPTLQQIRTLGCKLALATSASRTTMMYFLNQLYKNVQFDTFDTTVCESDIVVKRPTPENIYSAVFSTAARQLRVAHSACVVVANSSAGVQAALAVGMHVITYRFKESNHYRHILAHCKTLPEVARTLSDQALHNRKMSLDGVYNASTPISCEMAI